MSVARRVVKLSDRFYDRMRHADAFAAARGAPIARGFGALRGEKYALLVTYRRSGEPVPTPVWFGLDADGRVYVRTEADAGKVKRLRATPRVLVGPASFRGRPKGPLAEGTARVLESAQENEHAERALSANYGLERLLYERVLGRALPVDMVYLEITASSHATADGSDAQRQAERA
jgi:PPOX class probable F420-dependent enzyme